MNIDEARKVLWLKSNRRPLGDLLDEGFLNPSRLEWAAEKAYDPVLKQAAQVILESMNRSSVPNIAVKPQTSEAKEIPAEIEIGISLDRARATIWPFSSHKGLEMGELVESKQLSLKDLGFAIETARDPKVRQAAIALSLERLHQAVKEPAPSAGFVHIVSGGRSYSQRRESIYTLVQGALFGIAIAFSIYFLFPSLRGAGKSNSDAFSFSEFISRPNGILSFVTGLVILILLGWLFNFVFERVNKKIEEQIEAYRLGQEGEDSVVQRIIQALDGNWHLFRNIVIPGRTKADLDLVLVGPPGVWALEVKNFRGEYRNTGETWEIKNGKNWKGAKVNPSRQANNNSLRLKNFLKADGINAFVNPAIVWANSEGTLAVENPTIAVWRSFRLADELGNIWQGEKLSEAERSKIVDKLTKLCDRQRIKS